MDVVSITLGIATNGYHLTSSVELVFTIYGNMLDFNLIIILHVCTHKHMSAR